MPNSIYLLSATSAAIALMHTVVGPDHYVPFIALAHANAWSRGKTLLVTLLCGIGHVAGSIMLGGAGIVAGLALNRLQAFESIRGTIAVWAMIAFGILYALWGVKRSLQDKQHTHASHDGATISHSHFGHAHTHHTHSRRESTVWMLFIVFVLGPCEPLIPIVMYPAVRQSMEGMLFIIGIFSVVTILTMLTLVLLGSAGMSLLPSRFTARWMHALAGGAIALSGLMIVVFGL